MVGISFNNRITWKCYWAHNLLLKSRGSSQHSTRVTVGENDLMSQQYKVDFVVRIVHHYVQLYEITNLTTRPLNLIQVTEY